MVQRVKYKVMKIEFKRFGGWTWWKLELALLDFSFVQDKQFPAIYIRCSLQIHFARSVSVINKTIYILNLS